MSSLVSRWNVILFQLIFQSKILNILGKRYLSKCSMPSMIIILDVDSLSSLFFLETL